MSEIIQGKAYVVGDNIDTDQIIPAEHLALVPTIQDEYLKLGGYALSGLPAGDYPTRLVEPGCAPSPYRIVIGGRNFGCGSSREHAPIALGAAGVRAVVAESFARIFFRNCLATGELYPVETPERLVDAFSTGDEVLIDIGRGVVRRVADGREWTMAPLGEVEKVVGAGGLFAYARATGLAPQRDAS